MEVKRAEKNKQTNALLTFLPFFSSLRNSRHLFLCSINYLHQLILIDERKRSIHAERVAPRGASSAEQQQLDAALLLAAGDVDLIDRPNPTAPSSAAADSFLRFFARVAAPASPSWPGVLGLERRRRQRERKRKRKRQWHRRRLFVVVFDESSIDVVQPAPRSGAEAALDADRG